MLGGNHADKLDLAWYLAVAVQSRQSISNVYGWESTSNSRDLIAAIHKESNDTATTNRETTRIFVLLNLNPQNSLLEALKKLADGHKTFVIATTESPKEKWSLSQSEKRLWLDSNSLSYESKVLAQAAIERIPRGITLNSEIKAELCKLVSEQLDTVASVDACIDWLRNCEQEISSEDIDAAVQIAKENKKERLKKWFRTLTPREQLLALGITLFNGLHTDQFFAALERLVRRAWQQRDPSLRTLDHCDLENLGNYYEFSEVTEDDDFVLRHLNVKDPESGKLLLCIAWESHRRQIITALEEITQIIQNSAQGNFPAPSDWTIYGTSTLQKRLYARVSEPFAEVGLATAEATSPVRDFLARLAADGSRDVQDFAATVLAYWYKREAGKLLKTLDLFYNTLFNGQSNQQDHIKATVALTVSYASLNDPPSQMQPELCAWLTILSISESSLVRNYFGSHTLAYVVPRHLPKICSILKKIAERQNHLSLEIARSLASAYSNYPNEVLECLKIWAHDGKQILLCIVARTYGLINCSIHPDKLTSQSAFEQLQALLQEKERSIIRKEVIEGMSDRLRQDCLTIAPMLLTQVSKITKSERNQLVSRLTEIYLDQRRQLKDGESFYEIDKVRYQIWIDTARPLTEIETVLLQWLGQTQNRTAQQIATQAAIEFARALDIDEATELSRLRNVQSPAVGEGEDLQEDNSNPWHENWLAPLAAWLATLQAIVYQPVVQNILPEALIHYKDYRAGIDFVLRKWEQSPSQSINNNLKLKPIAVFLRRGLWIMNNKVFLMRIGAGVTVLSLMGGYILSKQINNANKIAVIPSNQSPIITAPPNKTVNKNSDLNISDIGIKAPDGKNGEVKVTLSVANGSLQVKPNAAVELEPSGNNSSLSSSVTLKGTISAINTSLATPAAITYRGKQGYDGEDFLKIQVDNGSELTEKVLTITVNSANDVPTIAAPQPAERVPETLPSTSQSNTITQKEALSVIRNYLEAKRKFFAPPFLREAAARCTTGKFYKENIKVIGDLDKGDQYYQYGKQQLKFLGRFDASYNEASIDVSVTEPLTIYTNGSPGEVLNKPKRYRFVLKLENDTWKISERTEIK